MYDISQNDLLDGECADWRHFWDFNTVLPEELVGPLHMIRTNNKHMNAGDQREFNCTDPLLVRQILAGPLNSSVAAEQEKGWAVKCDDFYWKRQECNSTDYTQLGLCVNESIANCGDCVDHLDYWLAPCGYNGSEHNSPGVTILSHYQPESSGNNEVDSALITGASVGGMFIFLIGLYFVRRTFCPPKRRIDEDDMVKVNHSGARMLDVQFDDAVVNPTTGSATMFDADGQSKTVGVLGGEAGVMNPMLAGKGNDRAGPGGASDEPLNPMMGGLAAAALVGAAAMSEDEEKKKKAGGQGAWNSYMQEDTHTGVDSVDFRDAQARGEYGTERIAEDDPDKKKKLRSGSILVASSMTKMPSRRERAGPGAMRRNRSEKDAAPGSGTGAGAMRRYRSEKGAAPRKPARRGSVLDQMQKKGGRLAAALTVAAAAGGSEDEDDSDNDEDAVAGIIKNPLSMGVAATIAEESDSDDEDGAAAAPMVRGKSRLGAGAADVSAKAMGRQKSSKMAAAADDEPDSDDDSDDDDDAADVSAKAMGRQKSSKMAAAADDESDSDDDSDDDDDAADVSAKVMGRQKSSKVAAAADDESDSDDDSDDDAGGIKEHDGSSSKATAALLSHLDTKDANDLKTDPETRYASLLTESLLASSADRDPETHEGAAELDFKYAVVRSILSQAPAVVLPTVRKAVGGEMVELDEAADMLALRKEVANLDSAAAGKCMVDVSCSILSSVVDAAAQKIHEAKTASPGWELAKADEAALAIGDVMSTLVNCEALYGVVAGTTVNSSPRYCGKSSSTHLQEVLDAYARGEADGKATLYRDVESAVSRGKNAKFLQSFLGLNRSSTKFLSGLGSMLKGKSDMPRGEKSAKPFGNFSGGLKTMSLATVQKSEVARERRASGLNIDLTELDTDIIGSDAAIAANAGSAASVMGAAERTWGASGSKQANNNKPKPKWQPPTPNAVQAAKLPIPDAAMPRKRRTLYGPFLCGPMVEATRSPSIALQSAKDAFKHLSGSK